MDNSNETKFLQQVDGLVHRHMEEKNVVGGAIAILVNNQLICTKLFGYADRSQKKVIEPHTLFQAGSLSKTITAWGIMKLVEDGMIALDQPVNTILQGWKLPDSRFSSDEVTIKRLLSHTAGISISDYYGYDSLDEAEKQGSLTSGLHIQYQPGTVFRYSGGGYTILQMAIESVKKMSFDTFMKNAVMDPLGMKDSTFASDVMKGANASKCYGLSAEDVPGKFFIEKAAAGLYTTITDITQFVQKNIYYIIDNRPEEQLLKGGTIRTMHTKVTRQMPYGLGYFTFNLPDNVKLVMHNGRNTGYCSKFLLLPRSGDGIVILTNSDNGIDFIADVVHDFINWKVPALSEYYKEPIGMIRQSAMSKAKRPLSFEGKYFV